MNGLNGYGPYPQTEAKDTLFITLRGRDFRKDYRELGLSFRSSGGEIMDRVAPIVKELFGEEMNGVYKVRKAINNRNIYLVPNVAAG